MLPLVLHCLKRETMKIKVTSVISRCITPVTRKQVTSVRQFSAISMPVRRRLHHFFSNQSSRHFTNSQTLRDDRKDNNNISHSQK